MIVPSSVRASLRERVWREAERLGWEALNNADRSQRYEEWTADPEIGGVLEHYLEKSQIRVYIKDTLLKPYARIRLGDPARVMRVLRIPPEATVVTEYQQPHGRVLADGRVIAWGRADDWRLVLMALYERSFGVTGRRAHAAVLLEAAGRFDLVRPMVEDAARRLGIEHVVWLDT